MRLNLPQGYEWRVVIDQDVTRTPAAVNGQSNHHDQVLDQDDDHEDQVTRDQMASALHLAEMLADQLNTERERTAAAIADRDHIVADRDRHIAKLEQTRYELAGRVGYFQGELAAANDRLLLLESPKPEPMSIDTAPAPDEPRRRWWWPLPKSICPSVWPLRHGRAEAIRTAPLSTP